MRPRHRRLDPRGGLLLVLVLLSRILAGDRLSGGLLGRGLLSLLQRLQRRILGHRGDLRRLLGRHRGASDRLELLGLAGRLALGVLLRLLQRLQRRVLG